MSNIDEQFQQFLDEPLSTEESRSVHTISRHEEQGERASVERKFWWMKEQHNLAPEGLGLDSVPSISDVNKQNENTPAGELAGNLGEDDNLITSPNLGVDELDVDYSDDFTDDDIGSIMEQLSQLAGSGEGISEKSMEEILKEAEELVRASSHSFTSSSSEPSLHPHNLQASHVSEPKTSPAHSEVYSAPSKSNQKNIKVEDIANKSSDTIEEVSSIASVSDNAFSDEGKGNSSKKVGSSKKDYTVVNSELSVSKARVHSVSESSVVSSAVSSKKGTKKERTVNFKDKPAKASNSKSDTLSKSKSVKGTSVQRDVSEASNSHKENKTVNKKKAAIEVGDPPLLPLAPSLPSVRETASKSDKSDKLKTRDSVVVSPPLLQHGNILGTADMIYQLIDEEVKNEVAMVMRETQSKQESSSLDISSKSSHAQDSFDIEKEMDKIFNFPSPGIYKSNDTTDLDAQEESDSLNFVNTEDNEILLNFHNQMFSIEREPLSTVLEESSVGSSLEGDGIEAAKEPQKTISKGSVKRPDTLHLTIESKVDESRALVLETQLLDERSRALEIQAELEKERKDHRRQMDTLKCKHEEEIFKLRKEIIILTVKVTDYEKNRLENEAKQNERSRAETDHRVLLLEGELQKQEQLILGYERENRKLCQELKTVKDELKAKETQFDAEKQHIQLELLSVKQGAVATSSVEKDSLLEKIKDKEEVIVRLELEIDSLKAANKEVVTVVEELKNENQTLKCDLEKQKALAMANRVGVAGSKSIVTLNKELDNYKMDVEKRNLEIQSLTHELEFAKVELDSKTQEYLITLTEKQQQIKVLEAKLSQSFADLENEKSELKKLLLQKEEDKKIIQDLNRQVKEMERIVKRKQQGTASAVLPGPGETEASATSPRVTLLEDRVQQLEHDLASKEQESLLMVKDIQDKFQAMKAKYEEHVSDLELHLESARRQAEIFKQALDKSSPCRPNVMTAETGTSTDEIKEKELQISTQQHTSNKPTKKTAQHVAPTIPPNALAVKEDAHLMATIRGLKQELTAKEKEAHRLGKELEEARKTNRRLQQERERHLTRDGLSSHKPSGAQRGISKKEKLNPVAVPRAHSYNEIVNHSRSKMYDPSQFECPTEQEEIVVKLEQENKALKADLANLEAEYRRLKTKRLDDLNILQQQHQREVERIVAEHSVRHSGSRMAELQSQLCTQQIVIAHLKDQLKQINEYKEEIVVLKTERDHLEKRAMELSKSLTSLRSIQTPETLHYEALQEKIDELERRHEFREQKLQSVVRDLLRRNAEQRTFLSDQQRDGDAATMREKLIEKNRQLCLYRAEIDRILDTLRELNIHKKSSSSHSASE